jgi:hypothetical protein
LYLFSLEENKDRIQQAAAFVAARLNHNHFDATPAKINMQSGVKWMWLGSYVEQIARLFILFCASFLKNNLS